MASPGKNRKTVRRKMQDAPLIGQRTLGGKSLAGPDLHDKIPRNVHTLFVGINPGIRSARINHYYAGHSNHFWKLFHAAGFWPVPLTTEDDDLIVLKGFGLTDVAKRPTPGTAMLSAADFASSRDRIRNIAREYQPETIAFVSKTATRAYMNDADAPIAYGLQEWDVEGCAVFNLPSTSGASMADTTYTQKLHWFQNLRAHVGTYYRF